MRQKKFRNEDRNEDWNEDLRKKRISLTESGIYTKMIPSVRTGYGYTAGQTADPPVITHRIMRENTHGSRHFAVQNDYAVSVLRVN